MAIHLVAVAAVHLARGGGATTQVITSLVWPYLLKVCLSLRVAPQDIATSSRFFLFQLARIIALGDDHDHGDHHRHSNSSSRSNSNNNNSRWDRAVRLVRERIAQLRGVMEPLPHDEDSLQILSSLAL